MEFLVEKNNVQTTMSCPWLQHFIGKMATISQSIPWFSPWFTGLPWHSPFQKLKFPSMLIKQCLKIPGETGTVLVKTHCLKKWFWHFGETWISYFKIFQTMDSKILVFPRFTPVTDHFHRRVFVGLKKKYIFRHKRRFKASIVFFCKLALRCMYRHCQKNCVQQQIAACGGQTFGNVIL